MSLHGDGAQSYAGEDIGIVRLVDAHIRPIPKKRREGASDADDRPAIRPRHEIGWSCLGAGVRIRQWKNHRPIDGRGHVTHNVLRKGAGLTGNTDEHRRPCIANDVAQCAKNFGNAMDSFLMAGGAYVTGETKTSFKGYYRGLTNQDAALIRSFVQFDGEGETANARQRDIGGHPALVLKNVCLRKDPRSPYANENGYVPFGNLEDYSDGRSDGCTSWSPSDARQIIPLLKDNPTTLYIYPESRDIEAVAQAVLVRQSLSRAGLYWNAFCLKQIGAPKFWPKEVLEPILARYRKGPEPPVQPPVCRP
jgi:hypothetical protein